MALVFCNLVIYPSSLLLRNVSFFGTIAVMGDNIIMKAWDWAKSINSSEIEDEYYCKTRDVFHGRLSTMVAVLVNSGKIPENDAYMLAAIAGEIGNNSFDHNVGNWTDDAGVFFGYALSAASQKNHLTIVLADRGRGVLETLKRVKPELSNDEDALFVAFNEKISGRAPEPRGNGLKFVKENIKGTEKHLLFVSGNGKIEINEVTNITREAERIQGCYTVITI